MTTCPECGAPMKHLDQVTVMCSRLHDLALRRFKANDHREARHASLAEVPDVVEGAPGLVFTRENAPRPEPAAPFSIGATVVGVDPGYPGGSFEYVTFTERGFELGGKADVMKEQEARALADRELERQFNRAYERLADEGACDAPYGGEYERVKAEWVGAGRPEVEPFIRRRANVVPGPDGKLPPI